MSAPATTTPQAAVDRLFAALDAFDVKALDAIFLPDAQGVDELSGEWRRGRDAMREYLALLTASGVDDLRSTVTDARVIEWGDTALATMVVDQTYTTGGERVLIQAPATLVLRREDGAWRLALAHIVPVVVAG